MSEYYWKELTVSLRVGVLWVDEDSMLKQHSLYSETGCIPQHTCPVKGQSSSSSLVNLSERVCCWKLEDNFVLVWFVIFFLWRRMSLNVHVLKHGLRLLWWFNSTFLLIDLDSCRSRFPVSTNFSSTILFMWDRFKAGV